MSNKEKISKLIEVVGLITKRCEKIEKDVIQHIRKLEKRIAELENK
jgi:hypothetical protein